MVRPALLVAALLLAVVGQTSAQPILYDNGPINATNLLVLEISGPSASDSFTLANTSHLTGVQLGLWTYGQPPASLQWSIGTTPFGSDQGSGTTSLISTFRGTLPNTSAFSAFTSTFPLSMQLASGTYWLTLQNATGSGDGYYGTDWVGWSQNSGYNYSGPPPAYFESTNNPVGSESFQIFGTEAVASPEPASITLIGNRSDGDLAWTGDFEYRCGSHGRTSTPTS